MIFKKLLIVLFVFIPFVFGVSTNINAQISNNSNTISLIETQNDYQVYAQEPDTGYLHLTVID